MPSLGFKPELPMKILSDISEYKSLEKKGETQNVPAAPVTAMYRPS
jgi:hypothetical protein